MKHLFIVNPKAGGKDKSIAVSRAVRAAFENRTDEYEVYVTIGPMDAPDRIRAEASAAASDMKLEASSSAENLLKSLAADVEETLNAVQESLLRVSRGQ